MSIDLSPAFFDLQLHFASHVARINDLNFEEALLSFTNIYLQCIGRSFDPADPTWLTYLKGLRHTSDKALWTASFYESQKEPTPPSAYGCFRYTYLADEQTIRLHFSNVDSSGYGSLSKERIMVRLKELKTLFTDVKKQYPEAQRVQGASWLYNIDAYKRLFPSQYTHENEMGKRDEEFQYLALWGQFLQRDGQVREPQAHSFLSCCSMQQTLEGLVRCFPYQVLEPSCSIASFYEFYEGITPLPPRLS